MRSFTTVPDILRMAAEDVERGMWCKGGWFKDAQGISDTLVVCQPVYVERAKHSRRCAQGSIALATAELGGTTDDLFHAYVTVNNHLRESQPMLPPSILNGGLVGYNDDYLPDDPVLAGTMLAALFRDTADNYKEQKREL